MTTDPAPAAGGEAGPPRDWERDVAELEQHSFTDSPQEGTRSDAHTLWRRLIFGAGLVLAVFHLYTGAFGTIAGLQQRSFHLAVALALVFLLYPGKPWHSQRQRRFGWALTAIAVAVLAYLGITGEAGLHVLLPALGVLVAVQLSRHLPWGPFGMPIGDIGLSLLGLGSGLYVFVFYEDIVDSPGLIDPVHVAAGTVGILLVLLAAQRTLGTALVVLASIMLVYAYRGEYFAGFLQHSGYSLDRIVTTSFLGTEGVFGTPIAISSTFIFLFLVFAAVLQRTGMERFFTELALGSTGWATGGTAKVGVVTSAFSGTITGSSVANTVSNGAFTIPMMRKSGYNREFAGAVEAASSTGGQIAPPIMGAGAFIMIEITGIAYIEILKAAAIPAVLFFVSQFVVIHYESKRLGIRGVPKYLLPSVRRLLLTRGYLLAPLVIIFVLLSSGRTPIYAAMGAIVIAVAVNLVVQLLEMPVRRVDGRLELRPAREALYGAVRLSLPVIIATVAAALVSTGVAALTEQAGRSEQVLATVLAVAAVAALIGYAFRSWTNSDSERLTLNSMLDGLVSATRIALPIIVACAAAGMIAGVITLTGIGLKLSGGLVSLSQGMLLPTLLLSMLACLVLGIGLPTTANYVITATLAAPAIITVLQGGVDEPTMAMLLMAHLFVYYFGVMADITPPVCLAAYAASGISGGSPIRTGLQAVRIAVAGFVVPYMFVLSPELLMQNVTWASGTLAALTGTVGACVVGMGVVGYVSRRVHWSGRVLLVAAGIALLYYGWLSDLAGLAVTAAIFAHQWWTTRGGAVRTGEAAAVPTGSTE
ncbi:TRAP transporter 4TM/12TM fusion protein [Lipingzhangella halophila]|uniref:TRAP transporter 4TM/12TM fusion protein n=1 Tax=Lipingzhangella halophila TaxID=1783352 RepID=A0A7W7RF41_9ACTN|nr:TRAP transporter permease [Lipingzhangella halophila]MBB4930266.1 TRAP transporter 4TM/12TM fusion protein [Lipingzhangella halophila]